MRESQTSPLLDLPSMQWWSLGYWWSSVLGMSLLMQQCNNSLQRKLYLQGWIYWVLQVCVLKIHGCKKVSLPDGLQHWPNHFHPEGSLFHRSVQQAEVDVLSLILLSTWHYKWVTIKSQSNPPVNSLITCYWVVEQGRRKWTCPQARHVWYAHDVH